jgi:hypothetical protein
MEVDDRRRTATLTPEQVAQWDKEEERHQTVMTRIKNGRYRNQEEADAATKREVMQNAANKRKIANLLTEQERKNLATKNRRISIGDTVTYQGRQATVTAHNRRGFTVQFADGSIQKGISRDALTKTSSAVRPEAREAETAPAPPAAPVEVTPAPQPEPETVPKPETAEAAPVTPPAPEPSPAPEAQAEARGPSERAAEILATLDEMKGKNQAARMESQHGPDGKTAHFVKVNFKTIVEEGKENGTLTVNCPK